MGNLYLAGGRLREGEIDTGLDGELNIVAVDVGLACMLGICLCIAKHIDDISVPQVQELVHHARFVMLHSHGA